MSSVAQPDRSAPLWGRFDQAFLSNYRYENPLQDVEFTVTFTAPSGQEYTVDGFWDGGYDWRVRFMPGEQGIWRFTTHCTDHANTRLDNRGGSFLCTPPDTTTRFGQHGPLRLSANRHYFAHADGTPFFWLADTCWNGPLQSTAAEWEDYLRVRVNQQFSAVQFLSMQFIAGPYGDRDGQPAFYGTEHVGINANFFRRMDARLDALNRAGLLGVPALLWAAEWSTPEVNRTNPGSWLAEQDCVLLARYIVARWGAHHVVWILPGDAHYTGDKAPRWQRIGRAVFSRGRDTLVTLHPGGDHWYADDFRHEDWLDLIGYQSCHFGADNWLNWHANGPPAQDWRTEPVRPIINIEPCYEYHVDQSDLTRRFTPFDVRRAIYWSLLVSPTAGVTYGGHGVWGWDDGVRPPVNHPRTGISLPWRQALHMPAAGQMAHVSALFGSIDWPRLVPAPELVLEQPGTARVGSTIAAARSTAGDLAVVYTPDAAAVTLDITQLAHNLHATWFDPRTGTRIPATNVNGTFASPAPGEDFVLLLEP